MIKKLKKLKGAGIFKDFTLSPDTQEFNKFNLIYGWNGSGKTTLSRIFHSLESQKIKDLFPNCELELIVGENTLIKHNNLENYKYKTFVFNQAFIEENIDWKKQGTKSIVVIAEDKIEQRKRFIELKDKVIPLKLSAYNLAEKALKASEKEQEDFSTDLARSIKMSFQLIDTSDSHYLNYDKRKIKAFLNSNQEKIKNNIGVLTPAQLDDLRKKVRPIQKPEITFSFNDLGAEALIEGEKRIIELISTNVVNKSILRLQAHADINSWVQEGLRIHKQHDSNECEFCGQKIPDNRLIDLESHFNKEYTSLIEKLNKAKLWLDNFSLQGSIPDINELYEEMQEEYAKVKIKFIETQEELTNYLQTIKFTIEEKLANPLLNTISLSSKIESLIVSINDVRQLILTTLGKHNKKTKNFQQEISALKNQLELHYVLDGLKQKEYSKLITRIEKETKELEEVKREFDALSKEKEGLEASLANVAKGADDFNKSLHSFLGRTDISLSYDNVQKGYKITRTGSFTPADNLSEGEKTAIAFVYFTIKLKENGNDTKNSIIIVDDPISSFDANHLFHSLSFLKSSCEDSMQLFVLTHNFQYFRLVRDWLLQKNKPNKPTKSNVYSIEVERKDNERQSFLRSAHSSLLKYESEYHYLFNKIYQQKDENTLDIDSSYQLANYARKLLESFFSFKHPKARTNFYELMELACKKGNIDKVTYDKTYKFINKYSHNQTIEFHDSPVDNLLGEGENITSLVLEIIKKCDQTHYSEMEEICSSN